MRPSVDHSDRSLCRESRVELGIREELELLVGELLHKRTDLVMFERMEHERVTETRLRILELLGELADRFVRIWMSFASEEDVERFRENRGRVKMLSHLFLVHGEIRHDAVQSLRHVREVRRDLDECAPGGGVREITLVLGDLVMKDRRHASDEVHPHALDVLERDGISLVRHGRRSDLILAECLADFGDLASLEVPHVAGDLCEDATGRHAFEEEPLKRFRRSDLRRVLRGFEADFSEDAFFERDGILHEK